jgi:hypothetical protein
MEGRGNVLKSSEWKDVVEAMGENFTARQVIDRWSLYQQPSISRDAFSIAECRDCLRAWMIEKESLGRISARVGDGQSRSRAKVKSEIVTLCTRLRRFGIK